MADRARDEVLAALQRAEHLHPLLLRLWFIQHRFPAQFRELIAQLHGILLVYEEQARRREEQGRGETT